MFDSNISTHLAFYGLVEHGELLLLLPRLSLYHFNDAESQGEREECFFRN